MKNFAFGVSCVFGVFVVAGALADPGGAARRAEFFNAHLEAAGSDALNRPVGRALPGVRNVKSVLPGVLYRGGGGGGRTEIGATGLQSLCAAGFARAYYLYPDGFSGERTVSCTGPDGKPNALQYIQADYLTQAAKARFMRDLHARANDASAGPIFVHCWNGYHASGEIAAVALIQFCGYGATEAEAYWMRNQRGAGLITRIRKYQEIPELRIPSNLATAICPRD